MDQVNNVTTMLIFALLRYLPGARRRDRRVDQRIQAVDGVSPRDATSRARQAASVSSMRPSARVSAAKQFASIWVPTIPDMIASAFVIGIAAR